MELDINLKGNVVWAMNMSYETGRTHRLKTCRPIKVIFRQIYDVRQTLRQTFTVITPTGLSFQIWNFFSSRASTNLDASCIEITQISPRKCLLGIRTTKFISPLKPQNSSLVWMRVVKCKNVFGQISRRVRVSRDVRILHWPIIGPKQSAAYRPVAN
jgi:hypothetical protein